MPFYANSRDVSLIRHFNRELINTIIDCEVILFKISTQYSEQNIYGESTKRLFSDPIRINCVISREPKSDIGEDGFSDFTRTAVFSFLRDDLVANELVLQEGDILRWDNDYYELNLVRSDQLWTGRNPATLPATVTDGSDEYGYQISVSAEGIKTTPERIGVEHLETGKYSFYDLPDRI